MKPLVHGAFFRIAAFMMLASLPCSLPAAAEEAISFAGKTITIVIGSETGGTTDPMARHMGAFLSKYLPGTPNIIVQNRPGAHSLLAMNYIAQQAKPDGLTVTVGSVSQIDPQNYRVTQSRYDPNNFLMVGGVDLGGGIMIIRADALPRLTDKSAIPVVEGAPSGMPHSTMLIAAWGKEYLGWNLRWVGGYPSPTAATVLAMQRGEIDMDGFSTSGLTSELLNPSKYKIIYQTGSGSCSVPSSLDAIKGIPLMASAVRDKITDPLAQRAFEYWCNTGSTLIWMALPPNTPGAIVDIYRAAYSKVAADPEFLEQGKKFSRDFSSVLFDKVTSVARSFGSMSPEVTSFMVQLLRKQGLEINP
jgi:hypothetical protein